MDENTTTVISFIGFILAVGTSIITAINHKRCRSVCFNKKIEISVDIENTTPLTDANNKRNIPA
jgi:hypothetical protein